MDRKRIDIESSAILNTGHKIPLFGLGTFQIKKEEDITTAISTALERGYRLIDTASVYKNEAAIGDVLPHLLEKHNLTREQIFITTKLGPKDLNANATNALGESLRKLNLKYIDLYLIHWPGKQGLKSFSEENRHHRREAWLALESESNRSSKLKSLGVSNYTLQHLMELESYSQKLPAVLQNEFHPNYQDERLKEFCDKKNIFFQAYSSLGQSKMLSDPQYFSVSSKYGKTCPQLLLRWALQKGYGVIPKSKNPIHIAENCAIYDFCISEKDLNFISSCNQGIKYAWDPVQIL